MKKEINPYSIKAADLPKIILVDDRKSLFGKAIKWHTKEKYTHVMEMHKEMKVASQDLGGFKERSLEDYLQPHITLKFCSYQDESPIAYKKREKWKESIQADLTPPPGFFAKIKHFWQNRYDFLGIIGQLLGVRWINNPWKKYCSERVARRMRKVLMIFVKLHPRPSEIDDVINSDSRLKVDGYINLVRGEDEDG